MGGSFFGGEKKSYLEKLGSKKKRGPYPFLWEKKEKKKKHLAL